MARNQKHKVSVLAVRTVFLGTIKLFRDFNNLDHLMVCVNTADIAVACGRKLPFTAAAETISAR